MGEYPRYKGGYRTPERRVTTQVSQPGIPESLEVIGEHKVKEQEQEHRTTHAAGS